MRVHWESTDCYSPCTLPYVLFKLNTGWITSRQRHWTGKLHTAMHCPDAKWSTESQPGEKARWVHFLSLSLLERAHDLQAKLGCRGTHMEHRTHASNLPHVRYQASCDWVMSVWLLGAYLCESSSFSSSRLKSKSKHCNYYIFPKEEFWLSDHHLVWHILSCFQLGQSYFFLRSAWYDAVSQGLCGVNLLARLNHRATESFFNPGSLPLLHILHLLFHLDLARFSFWAPDNVLAAPSAHRRPDAPPRRGEFVASHAFFGLPDLWEEVGDSTLPTFVSLHLYKKVLACRCDISTTDGFKGLSRQQKGRDLKGLCQHVHPKVVAWRDAANMPTRTLGL